MDKPRTETLLLLLILFTASCLYLSSLNNPFIWDDNHLIISENNIRTFACIPEIFTTHLCHNIGASNFYRPIQSLSFMIDYAAWKLNPFGYHLTNLLLHLINIILTYLLVKKVLKNSEAGLLAALIFAVHPVNTEAVTYIAGRADPLSVVFFLSAFLFYINKKPRHLAAVFFFALSLLTKEANLIFPLLLILYDYYVVGERKLKAPAVLRYAPYFLLTFAYLVLRFFILGLPQRLAPHIPFGTYLLTMPKILVTYLSLLLFPVHLHMERLVPSINSIFEQYAVFYILILICLLWPVKILYRRSKPLFFFVGFFFITLLPMLNILTINAPMAEHWLYLPSIGAYAVVSYAVIRIMRLKNTISNLVAVILVVFLGFFSSRTVLRNIEWGRSFEFYRNLIAYTPHSARGHVNMAFSYIQVKDLVSAKKEFKTALELNPMDAHAYSWLGWVEIVQGNKKEAVKDWKKSLDIAPFYEPSRARMTIYLNAEDKEFRRLCNADSKKPGDININYRLSKIYINHGLYLEALYRLENVLEKDPRHAKALFNRAWIYSELGMWEKAVGGYKELIALTPNDPDLYTNLGYCYEALGLPKEAGAMHAKAKALKP